MISVGITSKYLDVEEVHPRVDYLNNLLILKTHYRHFSLAWLPLTVDNIDNVDCTLYHAIVSDTNSWAIPTRGMMSVPHNSRS